MFDITGQDIWLLSDGDLRELVGRLCEAELRRNGISPLAATWSGHQNATDGGVDVRVASTADLPPGSAIVRRDVGYQSKAEDMPRGKILKEMRPADSLRASIQELAVLSGAYIIVSSKGSVSYSALRERKRAMSDAVAGLHNADNLLLDFYDRGRVATWVRDHPGIVLWVRGKLGKAIPGWRPYDDWPVSNEGADAPYLVDDALRIQGPGLRGQSVSALKGIELIRAILSRGRGIVRLVGLSGTGKTRLAEALFDGRVGEGSLPPELAIYTNLSDSPSPQPEAVATELIAQKRRQVLVIDNCPPELHNRLSAICKKTESELSLLTIEYDVREDQPEGTDVFDLQPSSDDLIEKLLLRRVEGLSHVNANSIAKFANGNARVALALAGTIESGESVASLRNANLFERLFRQRNDSSNSLLLSAQACSLAYSFQGEDASNGEDAELAKLALVVGKDVRSLHTDISELQRRDLLQRRGVWRALLPHAIANRLAATALENILPQDIQQLFATAPPRLLKSVSRRIGYLHTSEHAQQIVREWLADGGRLGKFEELNELERVMLANVAPVAPISVLDGIKRAFLRQRDLGAQLEGEEFRTLLLSLAFESELFDRSVALILDLIEFEEPGRFANQVRKSFPSLFHLYLSGTHATVEQRIAVIDALLWSSSEPRRELGFSALGAMLQSSYFSSFQQFDFGGRSRDYGYFPKTQEDVLRWFRSALALCSAHDVRDGDTSARVRKILAEHLRGLWSEIKLYDEIDGICRQFEERRSWPEGWRAIRSIRRFRQEQLTEDENAKLSTIEQVMAPRSFVENVRALVLQNVRDAWEDIGFQDIEAQFARKEQAIIEMGRILAGDQETLDELIPELATCDTEITLGPLAKGLVDAISDRRLLWDRLVAQFGASDPKTRSTELLCCYLFNLQSVDGELTEALLRESVNDSRLSDWFPVLQARVAISSDGVARLKESIASGNIPAERFRRLAHFGSGLDDQAILELTLLVLHLQNGFDVALDIVWMRIARGQREKNPLSPELLTAGRAIVEACEFDRRLSHDTHSLEIVIEACLAVPEGIPFVERVIQRLKASRSAYALGFVEANRVLRALFAAQPLTVLNALFTSGPIEDRHLHGFFEHDELLGSPLDCVPEAILLSWCDEEGGIRYPLIASMMVPFNKNHNSEVRQWKEVSLALLDRAPDRIEILKRYINHFRPMSWTGSQATAWEANARLLDTLEGYEDLALATFARSERQRLKIALNELRQKELEAEKHENERFE
jgi:hypothetical protein